jgi:hypothetical protein
MPVEIRELVIRTVVREAAASPFGEQSLPVAAAGRRDGGGDETVQECVRQVLRILERMKER